MSLLPLLLAIALPAAGTQDVDELRRAYARAESSYRAKLALDELEAAYAGADEAGRASVTAAVGKALESEFFDVRAHAAEMLGAGLDVEPAIEALVRAAGGYGRESRELTEEVVRFTAEHARLMKRIEDFEEKMAELRRFTKELDEATRRVEKFAEFRAALVAALRQRGDDRCVDGLGDVLAAPPLGPDADPVVEALLELGTGPALRHVVRCFESFEDLVQEREKSRKKLARTRPERRPRGWRGTKEAWEAAEAHRIANELARFDERTAMVWQLAHALHLRLHEFSEAEDLPAPPESALGFRAWKNWVAETAPLLPEHAKGD